MRHLPTLAVACLFVIGASATSAQTNDLVETEPPTAPSSGLVSGVTDDTQTGDDITPPTEDAEIATIPVLEGDAKKGKRVFAKCKACHKLEDGKNATGPSLYGIFGRPAGTVDGFGRYSDALLSSGIVWDVDALNGFLTKPKDYLKGTNMQFSGLKKEKDILNLLTYLQQNAMP